MALWLSSLTVSEVATIVGAIVAVVTLSGVFWEYHRSVILSRVDHLSTVQQTWLTDVNLARIAEFLENKDDSKLAEVTPAHKQAFVCFLERIELLLRAKLIRPELAHYMFGYCAADCFTNRSFWSPPLRKEKKYFQLFRDFAARMKKIDEFKKAQPTKFARALRVGWRSRRPPKREVIS